jgi:hypothetical protein
MIALLRLLPIFIACFVLGSMAGSAISAGLSSVVNPLGATSATFAVRDDRVSADVRHVLAAADRRIMTASVGGGTVAVAVSGDRSMVAIGLSNVRPPRAPEGDHQIGLLLVCDDETLNLGTFAEGFFTGPSGEGWENSVAIDAPYDCTEVVITHVDAHGELVEFGALPIRSASPKVGHWARGVAS